MINFIFTDPDVVATGKVVSMQYLPVRNAGVIISILLPSINFNIIAPYWYLAGIIRFTLTLIKHQYGAQVVKVNFWQ